MRAYVQELHQRLEKTIVYVTHDQVEAMTMGDRVAVLRDGRLEQVDAPQALYDRPASLFVAAFIGSPAMNMLRGRMADGVLELGSARLPLSDRQATGDVIVGIRPEALAPAAPGEPGLEGQVALVESLGSDLLAHVEVDAPAALRSELNGAQPEHARVTARLEPKVAARIGDRIRLAVEPDRMHLFDPNDERALP
jgi:multiple sugar transport system ATP-binding protein